MGLTTAGKINTAIAVVAVVGIGFFSGFAIQGRAKATLEKGLKAARAEAAATDAQRTAVQQALTRAEYELTKTQREIMGLSKRLENAELAVYESQDSAEVRDAEVARLSSLLQDWQDYAALLERKLGNETGEVLSIYCLMDHTNCPP